MSQPSARPLSGENSKSALLAKILGSSLKGGDYRAERSDQSSLFNQQFLFSEDQQKKKSLYELVQRVSGNVLKRCSLNSLVVGRAGQRPELLKELVLLYPFEATQKLIKLISKEFARLSGDVRDCAPICNPIHKSFVWRKYGLRIVPALEQSVYTKHVLALNQSHQDLPNFGRVQPFQVLPATPSVAFADQSSVETISSAGSSETEFFKKVALSELKIVLENTLHQRLPLDGEGRLSFSTYELLDFLKGLHVEIFQGSLLETNAMAHAICPQAGMYGSVLRSCLGLSKKANDIDLYFKLPHRMSTEFIEYIKTALVNFFSFRIADGEKLSRVLHHSRVPLTEFEMNVFYLGYGAGLNITYFSPAQTDFKGFYLSNFACEIEDLFVPFQADFATLQPCLTTLSGVNVEGPLERLACKLFVVPSTFTHNALERLMGYALEGWLPCHGDFQQAIEHYFFQAANVGKRLVDFAKGLRKRLHMNPKVVDIEKDRSFWLAHLNLLLLLPQLSEHPLSTDLKNGLCVAIQLGNPLCSYVCALKRLMMVMLSVENHLDTLVLLQVALFPYSRTHAMSHMGSFPMPEGDHHVLVSFPNQARWKKSIQNWYQCLNHCSTGQAKELLDAWNAFFSHLPFNFNSPLIEEAFGLELPIQWPLVKFLEETKRELGFAFTRSLLPLLSSKAVATLSLNFIKGPHAQGAYPWLSEHVDKLLRQMFPQIGLEQEKFSEEGMALPGKRRPAAPIPLLALLFESQGLNWIQQKSLEFFLTRLDRNDFCLTSFSNWLIARYVLRLAPESFIILKSFRDSVGYADPCFLKLSESCLRSSLHGMRSLSQAEPRFLDEAANGLFNSEKVRFGQKLLNESLHEWVLALAHHDLKPLGQTQVLQIFHEFEGVHPLIINVEPALSALCEAKKTSSPSFSLLLLLLSYFYFAKQGSQKKHSSSHHLASPVNQRLIHFCLEQLLHEARWAHSFTEKETIQRFLSVVKNFIQQQSASLLIPLIEKLKGYCHQTLTVSLIEAAIDRLMQVAQTSDEYSQLIGFLGTSKRVNEPSFLRSIFTKQMRTESLSAFDVLRALKEKYEVNSSFFLTISEVSLRASIEKTQTLLNLEQVEETEKDTLEDNKSHLELDSILPWLNESLYCWVQALTRVESKYLDKSTISFILQELQKLDLIFDVEPSLTLLVEFKNTNHSGLSFLFLPFIEFYLGKQLKHYRESELVISKGENEITPELIWLCLRRLFHEMKWPKGGSGSVDISLNAFESFIQVQEVPFLLEFIFKSTGYQHRHLITQVAQSALKRLLELPHTEGECEQCVELIVDGKVADIDSFASSLVNKYVQNDLSSALKVLNKVSQKLTYADPLFLKIATLLLKSSFEKWSKHQTEQVAVQITGGEEICSKDEDLLVHLIDQGLFSWVRALVEVDSRLLEKTKAQELVDKLPVLTNIELTQLRPALSLVLKASAHPLQYSVLLALTEIYLNKFIETSLNEEKGTSAATQEQKIGQEQFILSCLERCFSNGSAVALQLKKLEKVLERAKALIGLAQADFLSGLIDHLYSYHFKAFVRELLQQAACRLLKLPHNASSSVQVLDALILLKSLKALDEGSLAFCSLEIPSLLALSKLKLKDLLIPVSLRHKQHQGEALWQALKKEFSIEVMGQYLREQIKSSSREELQEAASLVSCVAQTLDRNDLLDNESSVQLILETPEIVYRSDKELFYQLVSIAYEKHREDAQLIEGFLLKSLVEGKISPKKITELKPGLREVVFRGLFEKGSLGQASSSTRALVARELFTKLIEGKLCLEAILDVRNEGLLIEKWLGLCLDQALHEKGAGQGLENSQTNFELLSLGIDSIYQWLERDGTYIDLRCYQAGLFKWIESLVSTVKGPYSSVQSLISKLVFHEANKDFQEEISLLLQTFFKHWSAGKVEGRTQVRATVVEQDTPYSFIERLLGQSGKWSEELSMSFQSWVDSLIKSPGYHPTAQQTIVLADYLLEENEILFEVWISYLIPRIRSFENKTWVCLCEKIISYCKRRGDFNLAKKYLLASVMSSESCYNEEEIEKISTRLLSVDSCELNSIFQTYGDEYDPKVLNRLREVSCLAKIASKMRLKLFRAQAPQRTFLLNNSFWPLFEKNWFLLCQFSLDKNINKPSKIKKESVLELINSLEALVYALEPTLTKKDWNADWDHILQHCADSLSNELLNLNTSFLSLRELSRINNLSKVLLLKIGDGSNHSDLIFDSDSLFEEWQIQYEYELWQAIESKHVKPDASYLFPLLLNPENYEAEPSLVAKLYSIYTKIVASSRSDSVYLCCLGDLNNKHNYGNHFVTFVNNIERLDQNIKNQVLERVVTWLEEKHGLGLSQVKTRQQNIGLLESSLKAKLKNLSDLRSEQKELEKESASSSQVLLEVMNQRLERAQEESKEAVKELKHAKFENEHGKICLVYMLDEMNGLSTIAKYKKLIKMDCFLLGLEFHEKKQSSQSSKGLEEDFINTFVEDLSKRSSLLATLDPAQYVGQKGQLNPFTGFLMLWSQLYSVSHKQNLSQIRSRLEDMLFKELDLSNHPSFISHMSQTFRAVREGIHPGPYDENIGALLCLHYAYFKNLKEQSKEPFDIDQNWIAETVSLSMLCLEQAVGGNSRVNQFFLMSFITHTGDKIEEVVEMFPGHTPSSFYSLFLFHFLHSFEVPLKENKYFVFADAKFEKLSLFLEKIALKADRWACLLPIGHQAHFIEESRKALTILNLAHIWLKSKPTLAKDVIISNLTRVVTSLGKIFSAACYPPSWPSEKIAEMCMQWSSLSSLVKTLYQKGYLKDSDYACFSPQAFEWIETEREISKSLLRFFHERLRKLLVAQNEQQMQEILHEQDVSAQDQVSELSFNWIGKKNKKDSPLSGAVLLDAYWSMKEGRSHEVFQPFQKESDTELESEVITCKPPTWNLSNILLNLFSSGDIQSSAEGLKFLKGFLDSIVQLQLQRPSVAVSQEDSCALKLTQTERGRLFELTIGTRNGLIEQFYGLDLRLAATFDSWGRDLVYKALTTLLKNSETGEVADLLSSILLKRELETLFRFVDDWLEMLSPSSRSSILVKHALRHSTNSLVRLLSKLKALDIVDCDRRLLYLYTSSSMGTDYEALNKSSAEELEKLKNS